MDMTTIQQQRSSHKLSTAVFVIAAALIVANLIPVIFPGLYLYLLSDTKPSASPLDLGSLAILLISSNFTILGIAFFYRKKKISLIRKGFDFVRRFEVSKTVALFIVVILLGLHVGLSLNELSRYEGTYWGDFAKIEEVVQNWPTGEGGIPPLKILHVKNFLLKSSEVVFQNIKIIPFIASMALLLLSYFFTKKLTQKRFAGLVAFAILLQSHSFRQYDALATYANFWNLFYLLSIYVIYKKWYLSPVSFIASIFSKPITASYLPLTLFFTYRAKIPRRKKVYLTAIYGGLAALMVVILFTDLNFGGGLQGGNVDFDGFKFFSAFATFSYQLRFDPLIIVGVLPLSIGLYLAAKKGITDADSVLVLMVGIMMFISPFLGGFTNVHIHPYRYVSMIMFFAIGVGLLLSKRLEPQVTQEA